MCGFYTRRGMGNGVACNQWNLYATIPPKAYKWRIELILWPRNEMRARCVMRTIIPARSMLFQDDDGYTRLLMKYLKILCCIHLPDRLFDSRNYNCWKENRFVSEYLYKKIQLPYIYFFTHYLSLLWLIFHLSLILHHFLHFSLSL